MLSPKENWLEAVRFGRPEYVPLSNEPIGWTLAFDGNFRRENWTDGWGVGWEVGLAETVPFPKHNPLPDLDRLADYRFPDPDALVYTDEHRAGLAEARREVADVMDILKPGGGWICSPDQGIPDIPPENTEAMWSTARELGRYS